MGYYKALQKRGLQVQRYNLSITTGGLFVAETVRLVRSLKLEGNWDAVWKKVESENLLQQTHLRSAKNIYKDVKKRIETAYSWEVETLVRSEDPSDWGFVCMAFTARRYRLLRDAIVDVVLYKWQGGDTLLEAYELPRYVESIVPEHPELDELTPRTREDLLQILKRDMRDGGLLIKEKGRTFRIKRPSISVYLEDMYKKKGSADDLRFLLYGERDISKITGESADER